MYSSDEILGVFADDISGEIPFVYSDDAIVSFSQLDLTFYNAESVPEPLTILGSFIALGFGALFKKNLSSKTQ